MTTRLWWTLALSVGLTACAGGPGTTTTDKDTTDGGDTDTETDPPVVESAHTGDPVGSGYFEPYYFTVQATWGFNTTTGVVNSITPYGENPAGIYVLMGTQDWQADQFAVNSDEACLILLPLVDAGPVLPQFVADNGLFYGIEYDPANGAATSCTGDYQLDPAAWGYEPGYIIADPAYFTTWGVGVTNLLPEYEAQFDPEFLPFILGGYLNNEFLGGVEGTTGFYGHATELDANNNLQLDAKNYRILIPAEEVPVRGLPAPLAQAEYNVYSFFVFY